MIVEIGCLVVVGLVTWFVASEGIWGAAQTFLCTLLSGLLAMNFFEPLAVSLASVVSDDYSDIVALLGLFTGLNFGIRLGAEKISPSYIQVFPMLDTVGRWGFGAITGYLTMAILLTSLHTAPLPREFLGFKPERNNFFNTAAPDRQWLGFVQYVSERPLSVLLTAKVGDKTILVPRAFDGRFEIVGDPSKPYGVKDSTGRDAPQLIWPSFPIRYAMRRERFSSGQASGAAAVVVPVQITVPPAATGPAKRSGGETAPAGF